MRNSDNDFILYKHFSGKGYVYLMAGLDKTNSDYNDLLSIACYFAKKGKTVWNRPNVYEKGRWQVVISQ